MDPPALQPTVAAAQRSSNNVYGSERPGPMRLPLPAFPFLLLLVIMTRIDSDSGGCRRRRVPATVTPRPAPLHIKLQDVSSFCPKGAKFFKFATPPASALTATRDPGPGPRLRPRPAAPTEQKNGIVWVPCKVQHFAIFLRISAKCKVHVDPSQITVTGELHRELGEPMPTQESKHGPHWIRVKGSWDIQVQLELKFGLSPTCFTGGYGSNIKYRIYSHVLL